MSAFVTIGNTDYHYESVGTGDALIFIHAGIAHMGMWDAQMMAFSLDYRVVRYDVRGFGQTKNPAGTYRDHDDLAALLDAIHIQSAYIVGASNGGRISLDFAIAYPARVKKLVLVCPAASGMQMGVHITEDDIALEAPIEEAFEAGDLEKAARLEVAHWIVGPNRDEDVISDELRKLTYEMSLSVFQIPEEDDEGENDMLEPPALQRMDEVRAPTLVIQSTDDARYHVPLSQTIAAGIPGAHLEMIADAGHLPNMEHPARFNTLVRDFLDG
ncbi:MAG: alpha/beta fold hydrolase [Chloroflexota bacterium]